MSIKQIIISVLELSAIIFILWGLFNEDKFVKFEEKLLNKIKTIFKHK